MSKLVERLQQLGRDLVQLVIGVTLVLIGCGFGFLELKDGPAAAHTTHIVIAAIFLSIGFLIIAPDLITNRASKLVTIVVDARKNGLRWSDPQDTPPNPAAPSVSAKKDEAP